MGPAQRPAPRAARRRAASPRGLQRHVRQPVGDDDGDRARVRALRVLLAQDAPRQGERVGQRRTAGDAARRRSACAARARLRGRTQRHGRLGHAAPEGDEADAVAARGRVLEQREDEPLHLLDEPVGLQRVAVVDHEADVVGDAVLAHLAAHVLRRDRERAAHASRPAPPPRAASRRRPRRRARRRGAGGASTSRAGARRASGRGGRSRRARARPGAAAARARAPASTSTSCDLGNGLEQLHRRVCPGVAGLCRFFSALPRPRARRRGRAAEAGRRSRRPGRTGRCSIRWPSPSAAAAKTSSRSTSSLPASAARRLGALEDGHVGPVADDARLEDEPRDRLVEALGHADGRERRGRRAQPLGQRRLLLSPPGREASRVRRVYASRRRSTSARKPVSAIASHLDVQADAVGDLRAELPLLRVHRPHEQEARGVRHGDALPLDDVDAHRRRVEEHVAEVVVEEVDLVDVEDPAVRLGEQPGLRARRCPRAARGRCRPSPPLDPRWR